MKDDSFQGVKKGEEVLVMCFNYFYHGIFESADKDFITLLDPGIVYETGEWGKGKFEDKQSLGVPIWHISRGAIEGFGVMKCSQ